jgi:23S rRNA pseudouridine955/2504/2580 synthase
VLLDDKHGDFAASKAWSKAVRDAGGPRPKHLMLHAWSLRLRHPLTGEPLALTAPLPPSWPEILRAAGAGVDALRHLS